MKNKFPVKLSFLHSIVEIEGSYSLRLREHFSQQEELLHFISLIKKYAQKHEISTGALDFFVKREGIGIPYVQWSPKIKNKIDEIIVNLFSKNYEISDQFYIEKIYRHLLEEDKHSYLAFEISMRKEFYNIWKKTTSRFNQKEAEDIYNRGYGNLVSLLRDVRNRLKVEFVIDTEIIDNILDKTIIPDTNFTIRSFDAIEGLLRKYNFPPVLFRYLHHFMMTVASLDLEEEIAKYFNDLLVRDIDDIRKPPYPYFLPYLRDETKDYIEKLIHTRAKRYRDTLQKENQDTLKRYNVAVSHLKEYVEKGIKSLKGILPSVETPTDKTSHEVNSIILEIHRNITGGLWFLSDYRKKAQEVRRKLDKNEKLLKMTYDDIIAYLQKKGIVSRSEILNAVDGYSYFGEFADQLMIQWKKDLVEIGKYAMNELKEEYEKTTLQKVRNILEKDYERINDFFLYQTFKKDVDIEELHKIYTNLMEKELLPYCAYNALFNSVKLWEEFKEGHKIGIDEGNYIAINLFPYKRFIRINIDGKIYPSFIFTKEEIKIKPNVLKNLMYRYKEGVSVLVYDIRGSSFMASRLKNAIKQREIMNSFNDYILSDLKMRNVFVLKETGDGGICWFGDNAKQQYMHLFAEIKTKKGRKVRHSLSTGSDINMEEGVKSSSEAIKSSIRMIQAAEDFIQKNYVNYRDWFEEIKEMEIEHDGQMYALLPPEFRSLFRIGIGISTGRVGKDVDLGLNSMGDIDIFGSIVNNAHIFSAERDPMQSIVVMDHGTLFHYLFNASDIEFSIDKNVKTMEELVIEIMKYMGREDRKYRIGSAIVQYYGYFLPQEKDKMKSVVVGGRVGALYMDNEGTLYDEKDREILLLYSCILPS